MHDLPWVPIQLMRLNVAIPRRSTILAALQQAARGQPWSLGLLSRHSPARLANRVFLLLIESISTSNSGS